MRGEEYKVLREAAQLFFAPSSPSCCSFSKIHCFCLL